MSSSNWVYNVDNPNVGGQGAQITALAIVFTAVALVIVMLRLYVRGYIIKAFGSDDWVIIFSWFMSCGFAVVTIIQTKWGLGLQNLNDMPTQNIYNFGLLQFIGAPFYITSILGFKLALLLSYLRFMPHGLWYYMTIGVAVACTLFHFSFLVVQINLCTPVAKQWNPAITTGSCLKSVPMYTTMASLTIIFDVTVMLLPFPVLAKLQVQRRKKFVLLTLFALGAFITVIQIIRIQTIKSLTNYLDSDQLIEWSAVENNLGIIVASIPTLAPLVAYFSERSTNGSRSRSNKPSGGGAASGPGGGGARYALQTWGGSNATASHSRHRSGMFPLGSGVDVRDQSESRVKKSDGDSTEFILESGHAPGIVKRTEVVITSTVGADGHGKR